LLANGIDPSDTRKAQKAAATEETETFEVIAREWHAKFSPSWASSHSGKIIRRLELYIFPWLGSRPIKEITAPELLSALRRMGYAKDEMSGHGFRSMASTLLNEQGWNRDAIERQLAHSERNSVRAAYNYAEFMPERKRMMQSWADYLDGLKAGARIIPIRAAG